VTLPTRIVDASRADIGKQIATIQNYQHSTNQAMHCAADLMEFNGN